MSNYLQESPYGAYGGQPPQTNPPYIQPSYPNQYVPQNDGRAAQTHMGSNYDTSMSAYGYNNSIPGFNTGSIAPAAPSLPMYQGWNQEPVPLPSYSNPQNNVQYTGYGGDSYQTQQSYAPPQPQTYQPNSHVAPLYDEGELSEGEFDAYGGHHTGGGSATASANYGPNYYHHNDSTGYMNTAHRAVYPSGHDHTNQQHSGSSGNDYKNYERDSNSYSPYAASPLEVGQDERWRGKQNNNVYPPGTVTEQPANGTLWMQTYTTPSQTRSNGTAQKSLNVLQTTPSVPQSLSQIQSNSTSQVTQDGIKGPTMVQGSSTTVVANLATEHGRTTPSAPIAEKTPGVQTAFPKSVVEARKKAERAILNLWPYEVRFPNYVEEGVDENIVGQLFDNLGFSRAPKAVIAESKPVGDTPNHNGQDNASSGVLKVNGQSSAGVGDEASRILEEKSGERANTALAATSTAAAKIEPTEKEKNLKMKMEALRKSREERAQKAAAKGIAQPVAVASTASRPELSIPPTKPIISPVTSTVTASQSTLDHPPSTHLQPSNAIRLPGNVQPTLSPAKASPPQPIIPGLFLASNPSPAPPPTTSTMLGAPSGNQRKRPVAADFDAPASTLPNKRPFGQSRNDALVIDVSEEEPDSEDEDVAMDLESQADRDSPLQPVRKLSDQRTTALLNFPPLTNFPTRRAFISPPGSSAASTPPIHPGSKAPPGHPPLLQQKEIEIALLKKQIADFEAAKAAKRKAQQTSSGTATPQHQPVNVTSVANGNGDIASKMEASIQIQELIGIAEDKISSDQKKLAGTQAAEQEKAAELKRSEAESKRLRREKIATDLPRVDAEVEQGQLRLLQLREEMAKQEAVVQKGLDDKRRMAEEMQRLGQEAEDDLQEKKHKLEVLTTTEVVDFSESPRSVVLPTTPIEVEHVEMPAEPVASNSTPVSTKSISLPTISASGVNALPNQGFNSFEDKSADSYVDKTINAAHNEAVLASATEGRRLYIGNLAYTTTEEELQSFFKGYLVESISIPKNPRTNRSVGYAFVSLSTTSEANRAIAELSGKKVLDRVISVQVAHKPERDTEKSKKDEGDRRSSTSGVPHRPISTFDQGLEAALQEQVLAEADSHEQSEEDMDMDDSYTPEPAQVAPESGANSAAERQSSAVAESPVRMDEGEALADQPPNVQHQSTIDMDVDADEVDNNYEQPIATPLVDLPSLPSPVESPPFSPAPPESVGDFEQFSSGRDGFEDTANANEVRVNGSVPSEKLNENSNQIQFFAPYESPLKYFRAFRFHPDYKQQVSGGLKSMSYSHKIDPNTELCRYELAGGVCNDKTCEFQHFRDIVLPDDTILSNLGNPEEFPVDQQEKFREGLRQVLTDLRSRKVRDFDTIAAEVVAHRGRFLGDPSKILMLEGREI